eukprot:4416913-Amphidinium_carterae.1
MSDDDDDDDDDDADADADADADDWQDQKLPRRAHKCWMYEAHPANVRKSKQQQTYRCAQALVGVCEGRQTALKCRFHNNGKQLRQTDPSA